MIGKIVPYGNGGINNEKRTIIDICLNPIPQHLQDKLERKRINKLSKQYILEDISHFSSTSFPQKAINGHVDFSMIAWPGFDIKLPNVDSLISIISNKWSAVSYDNVCAWHIRQTTYSIGRKAFAERYNIKETQAGSIIGLLDLAIHETDDERIEFVPNNIHRFKQLYAHKGYVSKMLKLINGKEVADEDE